VGAATPGAYGSTGWRRRAVSRRRRWHAAPTPAAATAKASAIGAIIAVSSLRSVLGSVQSRFESTIVNLQTVSENLQSARSRIMDADFAAETAALTKAQILQQAGVAVLAQANAAPQTVLGLLR